MADDRLPRQPPKWAKVYLGTTGKGFKRHRGVCGYVLQWEGGPADGMTATLEYDASPMEAEAAMLATMLGGKGAQGWNVEVWTDCRQMETMIRNWMPKWRDSGWLNSKGEPVLDLYRTLADAVDRNNITFHMEHHEFSKWMESEMARDKKRRHLDIGGRRNGTDSDDTDREATPAPEEHPEGLQGH